MNFHDVRMRGFEKRVRLDAVLDWLLTQIELLPAETISINDACGRILAEDVTAGESVPPFRRSAMDGYALKGEETNGASDYGPLRLKIIGQSFPGDPFNGEIKPGEAVRIMTGAPVPEGADAVLPAEMTEEKLDIVEISGSVPPGKNVGAIGEDIKAGTVVLRRARQLRPQDVGLLASIGTAAVNVVRKPKVRLLITGNELYPAGKEKPPHTIFDSNSPMLQALIIRDQGEIESRRQLADDRESIAKGLTEPGAEVILVSGGSSVGAEDHAPSLVDELGELKYHGIAMRPASPAGVGIVGDALVFLLPGNPVSCLCAYDLLAGRAIRQLGGQSSELPYITRHFPLAKKIVSAIGRLDYCRVKIEEGRVFPIATSGASILSSTSRADGFVLIPEEQEGYPEGATVTIHLYDLPFGQKVDQ
jgi:molybdopterin molybdotransferase